MISTYSSRSVFLLGLVSSLQYLKNLASLANSYNSQIRATVFIFKRLCPSRFLFLTIYSSSSFCFLNNEFRFILHPPMLYVLYIWHLFLLSFSLLLCRQNKLSLPALHGSV